MAEKTDPVQSVRNAIQDIFLAGVGAAATVGEKASSLADDLVKKGELTVQQGKAVNEELSKRAHSAVAEHTHEAVKESMRKMTPEERRDFVKNVRQMADDIEKEAKEADAKN